MTRRRIPEHLIQQVKDSVNAKDFIGQYVDLKKVGKDHYGPCPFCAGKKFSVIPKKRMWYCFNCGLGGDALKLLTLMGSSFPDAVATVAQHCGVNIEHDAGPPPDWEKNRKKREKQLALKEAAEQKEREKEWGRVGRELSERFDKAKRASLEHPYLKRKMITDATGIGQEGTKLLIPMRDALVDEPLLLSLQTIDAKGRKLNAEGGRTTCVRTVLGAEGFSKRHEDGENPTLYICEGWATGWTINHLTDEPAVVCFSTNNIECVTRAMKERYPDARIVIAADNDRWTKRPNGEPWNPGVEAARDAAKVLGVEVAIPDFRDLSDSETKQTDYNDLYCRNGKTEALKWLNPKLADEAVLVADAEPGPQPASDARDDRTATNHATFATAREDAPLILDPGAPLATARQLIADRYERDGQRILHSQRGDIRVWSGTHYSVIESDSLRASVYEYLERAYLIKDGKHIPFKPTPRRVTDTLDAVKAIAHLESEPQAPFWLDGRTDPSPDELIACANGLLHLPTRDLLPHTPSLMATHALPFDYDPDAPDPSEWLGFLHSLWPDDQESIDTLQEIFGYIISGETRLQKIFLLVGPRRSGKGTIGRVVRQLLGTSNVVGPTLSSLSTNFGISPLVDRPLAIISDARLSGRTDQTVIVERLLSISGEDAQTVDRKYREPWTGQLPTRFLILTNELPRLTDTSGALAGRFVPLRLTQTFYGKEDAHLYERLVGELPGILRWALDGWERLRERGRFCLPTASLEMIEELDELTSPVGAFLRQVCVVEPGRTVSCDQLYRAWREWCQSQGRDHPGTAQSLGRDLGAVVPGLRTRRPRVDGTRVRMYEGLALGGAS
jgi:putative DNA primase/helicase